MPTPSRNAIYDATIRRMTVSALEETENRFAGEHAGDTEQQLADYLRRCARELGHTPWPREIPGGMTVQARFGSWELAVAKAGLPLPEHPDQPDKFRRVREETRHQRDLYRQKKARKRERAKERMKAQEKKEGKTVHPVLPDSRNPLARICSNIVSCFDCPRNSLSSLNTAAGAEAAVLRQHRTIVPASLSRLFAPLLQFEKREIHTVFLRFPNFELGQKSWLSLLVKLCGVALRKIDHPPGFRRCR